MTGEPGESGRESLLMRAASGPRLGMCNGAGTGGAVIENVGRGLEWKAGDSEAEEPSPVGDADIASALSRGLMLSVNTFGAAV